MGDGLLYLTDVLRIIHGPSSSYSSSNQAILEEWDGNPSVRWIMVTLASPQTNNDDKETRKAPREDGESYLPKGIQIAQTRVHMNA